MIHNIDDNDFDDFLLPIVISKNMLSKKKKIDKENKYKCECVQKPKTKLSGPSCEDDAAAVAVLPYQWNPTRGGPILANYLKDKKGKHTQAVLDLKTCTELINKDVETKIRVLAETLLCNINNNQCDIDCVLKKQELLSIGDHKKALMSIEKSISARIQDINEFKEQALKLEKERANELKKVLRDNFSRLITIGHISPKDVLKEFDDKIYNVNQQVLNNCLAYFELETQLRAQADQSLRKARSIVNQLRFGISVTQQDNSVLHYPSDKTMLRKRSKSADVNINPHELFVEEPNYAKNFDVFMTTLTNEYQKAIAILYKDFLSILHDFNNHHSYYCTIHRKDSSKVVVEALDQKVDEVINHLTEITFNYIDNQNLSENVYYIKLAKKKLTFIGNELNVTYSLLYEASHLWDPHMIRVALAQKLTLAAVEELVSRHDSIELLNEVTFNIALEQLATANDVIDLNRNYDFVITLLQQRTNDYLKHSNAEIERLNEYENIRIPLTDTLKAELDLFLYNHPIPTFSITDEDVVNNTGIDFYRSKVKDAFSREIFQTTLQAGALFNWRNGLIEKIENIHKNSELITKKIEQQINYWVKERSFPLIKRHSLKMISLEESKQRMNAVRDLRLAELLKHEQCLQSHLGAIDDLTKNLPTEVLQYITLNTPELYPLQKWVNNIENGLKEIAAPEVDDEVKVLKVMSYLARLEKHRHLFEESLNPRLESCKKVFVNRIQKAMASNLRFISSLKLLHEGGNHSAFEALEISSFLVNGSNALETCMHNSLSALNQLHNGIIANADKIINPLQISAKTTLSETGKNVNAKHKPQHKRK